MNEQRKDFLKILLIVIMATSVFSGNILGVCVSAFGLYGLQNDNIDMIKMILIPFIIEIVIVFMLGFGIFLAIIIVLLTPIDDEDNEKSIVMAVLVPIFVIIIAFGIFHIIVVYLINKFINDIYREKDNKTNESNNNNMNNNQNIQNTNIYAESSSVPPSLPPRIPSPVQQYDQMPGYPNNYPPYSGCYPSIDQNDAPPPYVNNPNIQVSDEKH